MSELVAGTQAKGLLRVHHGAALYVGSLIGPGLLLVPSLAVQVAGPASVIAWVALLVLSAPLAFTFAALGVQMPVSGGVATYVARSFGAPAGAATGAWFLTAVLIGAPTVSLIGGYYIADVTGSGATVAVAIAAAMYGVVWGANMVGLGLSSVLQLVFTFVLTLVIATAVGAVLPARAGHNWTPFAPHGWWAVGTAANILVWSFAGWEAVAQLAGDFQEPRRQLPRAILIAFAVVTVLYVGLSVATVEVISRAPSKVPLADLVAVGFGAAGRVVTAFLAVALSMASMNVYMAGASKLAASLARSGALPTWLAGDSDRSIPRRPLLVSAVVTAVLLLVLGSGMTNVGEMVRAMSACFIGVYVASSASAAWILRGAGRVAAMVSCLLVAGVALFSGWYLVVPLLAWCASALLRTRGRRELPAPG